jgi:hypothetical protein
MLTYSYLLLILEHHGIDLYFEEFSKVIFTTDVSNTDTELSCCSVPPTLLYWNYTDDDDKTNNMVFMEVTFMENCVRKARM